MLTLGLKRVFTRYSTNSVAHSNVLKHRGIAVNNATSFVYTHPTRFALFNQRGKENYRNHDLHEEEYYEAD